MFDLARARVSLECNAKRHRLWSHSDSNSSVGGGLTEVVWSADGRRAFVRSCGVFVESSLLGWDLRRQTLLPQDEVSRTIAASLRIRYKWRLENEQHDDDQILGWACSEEGRRALARFARDQWPYLLPAIAIQD